MLIGSPETKKGISGGQRKRVNLAMELLTDPSLLFLDEPTSGLSSGDTLVVMRLLRKLADGGKTILLTIHQPSLEVFRLLDNLVFVARDQEQNGPGNVVYYGPAYPTPSNFSTPRVCRTCAPVPSRRPKRSRRVLKTAVANTASQSGPVATASRASIANTSSRVQGNR